MPQGFHREIRVSASQLFYDELFDHTLLSSVLATKLAKATQIGSDGLMGWSQQSTNLPFKALEAQSHYHIESQTMSLQGKTPSRTGKE